jgi:hypothetical protein
MRYYKVIVNEYILAVGTGNGGEEISETEYNKILSVIQNRPTQDGYGYRLKTDLTWEQYELPVEEDPELTEEEALDILLGGAV